MPVLDFKMPPLEPKSVKYPGKAYHFGRKDYELGVGGEGQGPGHVSGFEGGFGSMRAILHMRGLRAKIGAKTKI